MREILDLAGRPVRNEMLEAGHTPKLSWAPGMGKLFPKGRVPAGFTKENTGYEGAWELSAQLDAEEIRPDIFFYPNGQVTLYCPGRTLELSLSEALALARLLNHQKPDAYQL